MLNIKNNFTNFIYFFSAVVFYFYYGLFAYEKIVFNELV